MRRDYDNDKLCLENLDKNPVEQFKKWLNLAFSSGVPEPIAMTLSTVDHSGRPSSRIVLLREVTEKGFLFYTNYESRKGNDLSEKPFVSLNFYWQPLDKQIRIEGRASKTDEKVSDVYFSTRPRESQLGAWASNQSKEIASREEFEKRLAELEILYSNKEVPRPPFWGGYEVIPDRFEFWQGRPNRLHDRFQYTLSGNEWKISRLSP